MPVRVTEIPGFQGQAINAPTMDPRAAGATGHALGSLAQTIGGISEAFGQHAHTIQKAENARQISETRNRLSEDYARFQTDLQSETDPQKRMEATLAFLTAQKQTLDDPSFSPQVRDTLAAHYDDFASRARIASVKDAADLTFKRAGMAFENEALRAYENNDRQGYEAAWQTAVDSGIRLPEQYDKALHEFNQKQEADGITREIHADPAAWLEENATPPESGDTGLWMRRADLARTLLRHETADTVDALEDAVAAGQITRPEQIDGPEFEHLRPSVREKFKEFLAKRADLEAEALRKSPENQDLIAGVISQAIDEYKPDGADFDEDYAAIKLAISNLENDPLADEFENRLDALRDGKRRQIDNAQKAAYSQLDKVFADASANLPAPKTIKKTVFDYIDDGFLDDPANLQALGFSEDQAKQIGGQGDEETVDASAKLKRFRELWNQREGEVTADSWTHNFGKRLAASSSLTSIVDEWEDPETVDAAQRAKEAHQQAHGAAVRTLTEFLKSHPGATDEQISKELNRIGVETKASTLRSSIIPARPNTAGGADSSLLPPRPEPAAEPGRETSQLGTFGGQPIRPAGTAYTGARATVFGGPDDPNDNGLSAFGGKTGAGGKEGVAIPLDILRKTYPGKDKAWLAKNVRVAVKASNGKTSTLPLADLGTAEWVWKRDKRPVLDLTPGAVKQLGGKVIYRDGKLASLSGLGSLSFSLLPATQA